MPPKIEFIQFSLLSPGEIKKLSVCEIINAHTEGPNSINDPRMGPMVSNVACQTCQQYFKDCPGHFGHIELETPVFHPHPRFQKIILKILQSMCHNPECHRCLITLQSAEVLDISTSGKTSRLIRLEKHCQSKAFCEHCNSVVFKVNLETTRNGIRFIIKSPNDETNGIISPKQVYDIFGDLEEEDLKIMGFNTNLSDNPLYTNKNTFPSADIIHRHQFRPEWMILTILPVLPPCTRPPSVINGVTYSDDITDLYTHIVKCNDRLKGDRKAIVPIRSKGRRKIGHLTSQEREQIYGNLVNYIYNLVNVPHPRNKGNKSFRGKEYRGIDTRLGGKEGLLRKHIIAKRTNHTARSVIGGDPALKMNELGVPRCVANKLVKPVVVRRYNYDYCVELLAKGKVKNVFYRNKRISLTTPFGTKIPFELSEDMVDDRIVLERKLQDGDVVLFNRQPTEPLC